MHFEPLQKKNEEKNWNWFDTDPVPDPGPLSRKRIRIRIKWSGSETQEKRIANSGGRTDEIDGIDGTDETDRTDGRIVTDPMQSLPPPPGFVFIQAFS